jgi:hypothetical protein
MKIKKPNPLKNFFEDCKKGKMGVMPYWEGKRIIEFVWTNGKGYGRTAKLTLKKEGIREAWKLYQEIVKLNEEDKQKLKKKNDIQS